MDNAQWALCIVETLIELGVDYFVCAPGSRSTPLLLALASHPKARTLVHFDERGVGFHALGYAKGSGKPAAVVVTSGTAVANLFPAVMEADAASVPLLLLTADRPPELRDCGANQACDQVKLFGSYVRWQSDLPCPDPHLTARYLRSSLSQAVARATEGPVHLNCMFREPLLGNSHGVVHERAPTWTAGELCLNEATLERWAERLHSQEKGLILAGEGEVSQEVLALAEKLGWPVIADILSSVRKAHPLLITHADLLLKAKPDLQVDAVVQFGGSFVSKTLLEWLQRQTLDFYLQVTPHTRRKDPAHLVTDRLQSDSGLFVQEMCARLVRKEATHAWTRDNQVCHEALRQFFEEEKRLTEPSVVWQLQECLEEGWALFLANSMPIRDANQLLSTGTCFGNRGLSGIDGNIATATGIAQGARKGVIALLGDLSCLHDLNSLSLLSQIEFPLVLCVINNQGGGIFSFLPVAQYEAPLEKFFAAAHPWTLEKAAELFHLPYFQPSSPAELQEALGTQRTCLIEIKTCRKENVAVHHVLFERVSQCLSEETLLIPT